MDYIKITSSGEWSNYASLLLNQTNTQESKDKFHTYWIVAGHHIRTQIADDFKLARLLRYMLPPYTGASIELFRGENQERWNEGKVGLAWTPNINIAKMFGRGLNSMPIGGILLKAQFTPEAIISGPNHHSTYLGEDQFTVDPNYLANITIIEIYPSI
jgi:hypothetical protein